jgi:hypothetical protein
MFEHVAGHEGHRTDCRVVLLPDVDSTAELVKLAQSITYGGSAELVVGVDRCFPHVTVAHLNLPSVLLSAFTRQLTGSAAGQHSYDLSLSGCHVRDCDDGLWAGSWCEYDASGDDIASLRKYCLSLAGVGLDHGDSYTPHLTLAWWPPGCRIARARRLACEAVSIGDLVPLRARLAVALESAHGSVSHFVGLGPL